MPVKTVLHFERHLIDAATVPEAMREAADLVAEIEATGTGTVVEISVLELGERGSAVVMHRLESDDEIPD